VLCGLIGALLAQGATPVSAARAGAWAHGTAADDLVAAGCGPIGLTASELLPAIRRVLNRLAR
jgi:NAD(P)H-hydrate repair Nnr-like enzyme with NAD(P)H-hydrate dehydratase domain